MLAVGYGFRLTHLTCYDRHAVVLDEPQARYDLEMAEDATAAEIKRIKPMKRRAA